MLLHHIQKRNISPPVSRLFFTRVNDLVDFKFREPSIKPVHFMNNFQFGKAKIMENFRYSLISRSVKCTVSNVDFRSVIPD